MSEERPVANLIADAMEDFAARMVEPVWWPAFVASLTRRTERQ